MATLNTTEKGILEKLFQMGGGYVLNFSDRSMGEFFRDDLHIDIYDSRFNYASGSKANRMRGFWQAASDQLVGKSIISLIGYIEGQLLVGNLRSEDFPKALILKGREIGNKLLGVVGQTQTSESDFVGKDYGEISIVSLGLDAAVTKVLTQRIDEIWKCSKAGANLSVVFMCGSVLEGVLLGVASKNPRIFNQAQQSPKDRDGKVLPLHHWKLVAFINVAHELGLLDEDVKKFSHALRDFRNYIHPYEQMASRFSPDANTAAICIQVLKAAISQLTRRLAA